MLGTPTTKYRFLTSVGPPMINRSAKETVAGMNTSLEDFKALQEAARGGRLDQVRELLDRGVDQNTHPGMPKELSPLMKAANQDHLEVVQLLVQRGANIHFMDGDGFTALTIAAGSGHWEIAKFLAEQGGDVLHKDARGLSALSAAERTGGAPQSASRVCF
ncbi:MAG: ankyrin repeat domain-containing protein [Phycisphaera sp. RhM]|nr:ankyrin repeat domain-containing protein [Phycisphaera sp. RhM]